MDLFLLLMPGFLGAAVAGRIETVAGTGQPGSSGDGGPAREARLNGPFHCDFDRHGNLYIADALNHCIRKVEAKTDIITTVAGSGRKGYSGDGGPATEATMNEPYAVIVNQHSDLFIVDRLNAVIRKVDGRTGKISTLAGSGDKGPPSQRAESSGSSGDGGPAISGRFLEPNDCFLDGKGGLLIADVSDWRVRRVDLSTGIMSTFAGTGRQRRPVDRARMGDGGPRDRGSSRRPAGGLRRSAGQYLHLRA